ncbi:SRPBCC domain-containing protein [Bradyrhizobium sp. LHD-71]|uniref:SRPBCC domain-containing protein n=1 Tax=Bradyrhizobium sp. LHD-71 TaxID=3072141 RepID=UPI00280C85B2|nr:SRPBCC domain-containing protein [Bradyrhizobium sp. LHD-71]MDQ8732639.1 SRPBCC domain-containing protein [Bradyrhizobium sp. LHD-71]
MNSRVIVSLRVAAAPLRAFEVFTQDIGRWWQPNELFHFTPRSPGRIALEPGEGGRFTETLANGKVFEIGRVTEWQPGVRLALTWRQATFAPDQSTHVEVLFEPVGDETRITVTHTGWDSVPQDHVARHSFPDGLFLRRHAEWWQQLLAAFRVRLTP